MMPRYRKEREDMSRGTTVPLFRVVVELPGPRRWGTVQAGLLQNEADTLLSTLNANEERKHDTSGR